MRLGDWLKRRKMSQADFAAQAGVAPPVVTRIVKHGRDTSGRNWARIIRATDGAVTPADHYPPEKRRKRAA
jgi:DNA-binding transcriptional regulator YdaS (Cro superfamily)